MHIQLMQATKYCIVVTKGTGVNWLMGLHPQTLGCLVGSGNSSEPFRVVPTTCFDSALESFLPSLPHAYIAFPNPTSKNDSRFTRFATSWQTWFERDLMLARLQSMPMLRLWSRITLRLGIRVDHTQLQWITVDTRH